MHVTTPMSSVDYIKQKSDERFRIFCIICVGVVLIVFAIVYPGRPAEKVGDEIMDLGFANIIKVAPPTQEQGP